MSLSAVLRYLERLLNRVSALLGAVSAVLLVVLLLNVFYDVLMRYLFNDVSIGMQELEWHVFSALFLFGVSYGMRCDGHVRVDLIYERLPLRGRIWIDILGFLVFVLPFVLVVGYYGVHFTMESFALGERSGDPGGLMYRWAVKALIPISFFAMALSGLGVTLRQLRSRYTGDLDASSTTHTRD
ncbi:MAG: TRAP transporter small permease subunit [Gammaproteobacteria bacterium]